MKKLDLHAIYARVALGSAAIVWCGSFAGSAAELNHFGGKAQMTLPGTLPVSLDLVAVAAAAARAAKPKDTMAKWVLRVFTLASLLIQVATTPWTTDLVMNVCYAIARGAPVAGGWVSFELALRAMDDEDAEVADHADVQPEPAPCPSEQICHLSVDPEPEPAGPVEEAIEELLVADLVPHAQDALERIRAKGHKVCVRNLINEMAAAGHPAGTNARAERLMEQCEGSLV